MKLILTCEHGGNDIPIAYKKNFENDAVLKTHRGYDLGALDLFHFLDPLSDASFFCTTSRLLVELNRSRHHRQLFSEFTKALSKIEKAKIIKDYYSPYRLTVADHIKNSIANGISVLHLSIHSFTPHFNGKTRNCDIGLLYDSTNQIEQNICKQFKSELLKEHHNFNIRFNYPYLGKADGFTTSLRKEFPAQYLGIEIEVNQNFVSANVMNLEIKKSIYKAINTLKSKDHHF
jgi:predicted N-formylglutamate amidohydrolase